MKPINRKQEFIDLLVAAEAFEFGQFKTKSGRLSPYFLNSGQFYGGAVLAKLAGLYAGFIADLFPRLKGYYLFGPAYKGISLAVAIAMDLEARTSKPAVFTFNRKEQKAHGEGGGLVGYQYKGGEPVLIVEDVLTGGTSLRDTYALMQRYKTQVAGIIVGIDRQERGQSLAAKSEIEALYGCPVHCLVTIGEIPAGLDAQGKVPAAVVGAIKAYKSEYLEH